MDILLDTNAFIWLVGLDSTRIGPKAKRMILEADSVALSAVSVAELRIKQMLGKLELPATPSRLAEQSHIDELPLASRHSEALASFPDLARHDPFDRLLLAQALVDGRTLLTADARLLSLHDSRLSIVDVTV